ncbi:MAG TPA: hypothetical protein VF411_13910 [Bacteroidia bacterium]
MKMQDVHHNMLKKRLESEKNKQLHKTDEGKKIDELDAQLKLKSIRIQDLLKEKKEDKQLIKDLRDEIKYLKDDIITMKEEFKAEKTNKKSFPTK